MFFLIQIFLFVLFATQAFAEEINDLSYSAPDQIVTLTQEFGKIAKIISLLSGQPCLKETDLVAKGAQDVILRRIFISQYRDWHANQILLMRKGMLPHQPDVESGWIIFPHIHLDQITIIKRKPH